MKQDFNTYLLVNEVVAIKSNRATAKRYRNLGYTVPDQFAENNFFEIKVIDLLNNSKVEVEVACIDCGKIRKVSFSDRANRCYTCANKITIASRSMIGSANPNYNPDISDLERHARIEDKRDFRFREWSRKVKERDCFTCQVCKDKTERFNSHHLEGYSHNRDIRYDISNGVCLCVPCHKKLHSTFGLHTTIEDYIEFKRSKQ